MEEYFKNRAAQKMLDKLKQNPADAYIVNEIEKGDPIKNMRDYLWGDDPVNQFRIHFNLGVHEVIHGIPN